MLTGIVRTPVTVLAIVVLALLSWSARSTSAAAVPGTFSSAVHSISAAVAPSNPLMPFYTAKGSVTDSIDGMGTLNSSGTIRVQKPDASAKVRVAFLLSASTGFTQYRIPNGDVTLNGAGINWAVQIPNDIKSFNAYADVTSIVKPVVDTAPAGITTLTVGELHSAQVDGEALAVVFNDPTAPATNSVALLFGAQNPAGDNFSVTFSQPVNIAAPNFRITMGLGDSFSFQTGGVQQFSVIDVNGVIPSNFSAPDANRLTTSAGGEDDAQGGTGNGALMTVGGIGDGPQNPGPACAACTPTNPRSDTEYYNLKSFVHNGDTRLTFNTLNPSNDDNIFFAHVEGNPPVTVHNTSGSQTFDFSATARCTRGGGSEVPNPLCGGSPPNCNADGSAFCQSSINVNGQCKATMTASVPQLCIWRGGGDIGGNTFTFLNDASLFSSDKTFLTGSGAELPCGLGCIDDRATVHGKIQLNDQQGNQHGGGTFPVDLTIDDSVNNLTRTFHDRVDLAIHGTAVGDQTYSWICTSTVANGTPNCSVEVTISRTG